MKKYKGFLPLFILLMLLFSVIFSFNVSSDGFGGSIPSDLDGLLAWETYEFYGYKSVYRDYIEMSYPSWGDITIHGVKLLVDTTEQLGLISNIKTDYHMELNGQFGVEMDATDIYVIDPQNAYIYWNITLASEDIGTDDLILEFGCDESYEGKHWMVGTTYYGMRLEHDNSDWAYDGVWGQGMGKPNGMYVIIYYEYNSGIEEEVYDIGYMVKPSNAGIGTFHNWEIYVDGTDNCNAYWKLYNDSDVVVDGFGIGDRGYLVEGMQYVGMIFDEDWGTGSFKMKMYDAGESVVTWANFTISAAPSTDTYYYFDIQDHFLQYSNVHFKYRAPLGEEVSVYAIHLETQDYWNFSFTGTGNLMDLFQVETFDKLGTYNFMYQYSGNGTIIEDYDFYVDVYKGYESYELDFEGVDGSFVDNVLTVGEYINIIGANYYQFNGKNEIIVLTKNDIIEHTWDVTNIIEFYDGILWQLQEVGQYSLYFAFSDNINESVNGYYINFNVYLEGTTQGEEENYDMYIGIGILLVLTGFIGYITQLGLVSVGVFTGFGALFSVPMENGMLQFFPIQMLFIFGFILMVMFVSIIRG